MRHRRSTRGSIHQQQGIRRIAVLQQGMFDFVTVAENSQAFSFPTNPILLVEPRSLQLTLVKSRRVGIRKATDGKYVPRTPATCPAAIVVAVVLTNTTAEVGGHAQIDGAVYFGKKQIDEVAGQSCETIGSHDSRENARSSQIKQSARRIEVVWVNSKTVAGPAAALELLDTLPTVRDSAIGLKRAVAQAILRAGRSQSPSLGSTPMYQQ